MLLKYSIDISNETIVENINRLTNLIFKLLPLREEGRDWSSLLQNLIIEIAGLDRLLIDQGNVFIVLCKLEGLLTLESEEDFPRFRAGVFECLGLMNKVKECLD